MNIWSSLSEIATAVADTIVTVFNKVSSIFWTPAVGETAGQITFVGYLAIAGLAITIITFAIRWIMRLINRRI